VLPDIAKYFGVSLDELFGQQPDVETISGHGLTWKVRRPPLKNEEREGVELIRRLTAGESEQAVSEAMNLHSFDVENRVRDVVYTGLVELTEIPYATKLEQELRDAYRLRDCVIVALAHLALPLLRSIVLGEASRHHFIRVVRPGMKVGLSGGYSVSRLVYSLRRGECRSIDVYPLSLSPAIEATPVSANSLVGALAYHHYGYDVRGYTLQYATDTMLANADPLAQAATRRILAKAAAVDTVFMGLGDLRRIQAPLDLLADTLNMLGTDLDEMRRRGAIGDILYHLVDAEGRTVSQELDALICSIRLPSLQEMVRMGVRVVALANGANKEAITRVTLRAGYVNALIADDLLAERLLRSAGAMM
jgi:deoxyribonucleoside regulator